jgi:hypothetical protein
MSIVLILTTFLLAFVCAIHEKIAVCICGIASRYQPESVARYVIGANENNFDFDVFLSLQTHDFHFSNHRGLHTKSTIFGDFDNNQIQDKATQIYMKNAHKFNGSIVVSTRQLRTIREYADELGVNELDRITQPDYWPIRGKVLGMFVNQEECAKSIIVKEFTSGKKYNYIIMSREDTFLYKVLNLTYISILLNGNNSIVTRRCLNWGGLATRMQVTTRAFGLLLYGSRTNFYRYLVDQDLKVFNTEDFEKKHVEWLHATPLEVSIEIMPVSISRYINQTTVCFINYEVQDNCVPIGYESFVQQNICA